jgi:formate dehydrogenase subunit delta
VETPPVVRLANDIGAQFRHLPSGDAAAEVANHIRRFWDPRMRAELLALADEQHVDLDAGVLAAVDLLREGVDR